MTDTANAQHKRSKQKPSFLMELWTFPLIAMVVALALAVSALILTNIAVVQFLPEQLSRNAQLVIAELLPVLALFLTYKLVIRRLGSRPHDDLPAKGALGDTSLGVLIGGGLISAVVGIAAISATYRVVGLGSWDEALAIIMMTGVWASFVTTLLVFGIIFRWLEEFGGSLLALILCVIIFGIGHAGNANATMFSCIAIALETGVLLCGAYMLTRSLWLAIGIQAGWNVVQGLVWDVPIAGFAFDGLLEAELYGSDWLTGGAYGLGASVITLCLGTAVGVWTVWQANKQGHWVKPMWSR